MCACASRLRWNGLAHRRLGRLGRRRRRRRRRRLCWLVVVLREARLLRRRQQLGVGTRQQLQQLGAAALHAVAAQPLHERLRRVAVRRRLLLGIPLPGRPSLGSPLRRRARGGLRALQLGVGGRLGLRLCGLRRRRRLGFFLLAPLLCKAKLLCDRLGRLCTWGIPGSPSAKRWWRCLAYGTWHAEATLAEADFLLFSTQSAGSCPV